MSLKVHDMCKATCGLENVGTCDTLAPQCQTLKDASCSKVPFLTECTNGHNLYAERRCRRSPAAWPHISPTPDTPAFPATGTRR